MNSSNTNSNTSMYDNSFMDYFSTFGGGNTGTVRK